MTRSPSEFGGLTVNGMVCGGEQSSGPQPGWQHTAALFVGRKSQKVAVVRGV